jgi:hypothetical protein
MTLKFVSQTPKSESIIHYAKQAVFRVRNGGPIQVILPVDPVCTAMAKTVKGVKSIIYVIQIMFLTAD